MALAVQQRYIYVTHTYTSVTNKCYNKLVQRLLLQYIQAKLELMKSTTPCYQYQSDINIVNSNVNYNIINSNNT